MGLGVILNVGTGVELSVRLRLVWDMVGLGVMPRMEISPWMNSPANPIVLTTANSSTNARSRGSISNSSVEESTSNYFSGGYSCDLGGPIGSG